MASMTKYHLDLSGNPAVCKAYKGRCPRGGQSGFENHFSTLEAAKEASERKNKEELGLIPKPRFNKSLMEKKLETAQNTAAPRKGVNVDQFERGYKKILDAAVYGGNMKDAATALASEPVNNRPVAFRKMDADQIADTAIGFLKEFGEVKSLKYSVNNKDPYDILVNDKINVELKLGSPTDAAIGLGQVNHLTGVDFKEPDAAKWRERLLTEYSPKFLEAREAAYRHFIKETSGKVKLGPVSEDSVKVLEGLVQGQNANAIDRENREKVTLMSIQKDGTWKRKDLDLKEGGGQWEVVAADYNETTNRVTIRFANDHYAVKMISNQKNSYKSTKTLAAGIPKIEPKYGFGALSFNVWVTEKETDESNENSGASESSDASENGGQDSSK